MAGAQFTTGSVEMTAAVSSMQDVNSQLQNNISQLQSEVEGVVGAWGGDAASAFQTLMVKFHEDATKLNNDLMQISEAVEGNRKAYVAQEQEQHSSMTNILNGL